MRKSLLLSLAVILSISTFAQENSKADKKKIIKEQAGRPDIPGDLMLDFGVALLQDQPANWDHNVWGSKFFNAYYLYETNIGTSNFSFHPGIGIGTEKYSLNGNMALRDSIGADLTLLDSLPTMSGFENATSFSKSKLEVIYVDIPMEIRWRSLKYEPKRSVKVAIGGKFGFRIDSKMKVKFDEDGQTKVRKSKEKYNLNSIRYGAYAKIGYSSFNFYYYYSFSKLFQDGRGPDGTEAYPMQVGISFSLF